MLGTSFEERLPHPNIAVEPWKAKPKKARALSGLPATKLQAAPFFDE